MFIMPLSPRFFDMRARAMGMASGSENTSVRKKIPKETRAPFARKYMINNMLRGFPNQGGERRQGRRTRGAVRGYFHILFIQHY
jgi:hypothetical protein